MMGDGAAVIPDDEYVYAPADGTVTFVFPTKHASDSGPTVDMRCCFMLESIQYRYQEMALRLSCTMGIMYGPGISF